MYPTVPPPRPGPCEHLRKKYLRDAIRRISIVTFRGHTLSVEIGALVPISHLHARTDDPISAQTLAEQLR